MQVTNTTYSAQYGHTTAGTINMEARDALGFVYEALGEETLAVQHYQGEDSQIAILDSFSRSRLCSALADD